VGSPAWQSEEMIRYGSWSVTTAPSVQDEAL
jgi:hypothetical protein